MIADLCDNNDVVFLQETWLTPSEINLLDRVHNEFLAFSISAVNDSELLVGRPFVGLSILWRKCIDSSCKVSRVNDSRILCFEIISQPANLRLINVYLPYYCPNNVEEYSLYIGKIASIIEGHETDQIMILGDFSAGLPSVFL